MKVNMVTKKKQSTSQIFLDKLYTLNKDIVEVQKKNSEVINISKKQVQYAIGITNAAPSYTQTRYNSTKKFFITNINITTYIVDNIAVSLLLGKGNSPAYSTAQAIFNQAILGVGNNHSENTFIEPLIIDTPQFWVLIGTPIDVADQISLEIIGYEQ
jgi:hypothetical protein